MFVYFTNYYFFYLKVTDDILEEDEENEVEEPVTPPQRRSPIMLRSSSSANRNLPSKVTVTPSTPTRSPHKYFTRSKTKDGDDDDHHGSTTTSPLSSPSSRSHQIKYVMPAEQPMERQSYHQNHINTTSALKGDEQGSNHITPMRARVIKRLELRGIGVTANHKDDAKEKKSWAQVLEEELDVSKKQQSPLSGTKVMTKKKKKRNFKRVSILEEIYGKDIYLKHDDDDEEDDENAESTDLIPSLNETSNTRPVPAIDQKVIGDLMSFNDDEEASNLIDLEDSRFMTLIKKSQQENNEAAHKLNIMSADKVPFHQSTLLQTPARDEYREKIDSLTPVLDTSNMHPVAPCRQFTKARTPYKQAMLDLLHRTLAEARNNRKDSEDVLDCTMATNADVTLMPSEQEDKERDNGYAQPLLRTPLANVSVSSVNNNNNIQQQPSSWLNVPNLTSPSMRAFPGKQDTQQQQQQQQPTLPRESQPEQTITKSLGELNLQPDDNHMNPAFEVDRHPLLAKGQNDGLVAENKPTASKVFTNIPNLHSPSMRLFSSSNDTTSSKPIQHHQTLNIVDVSSTVKQTDIPCESLFTTVNKVPNLHSPSMKMFPSSHQPTITQKQVFNTKINPSSKVNFTHNGLQSTVTFAPPKHSPASSSSGFLRAPSFTINHRQSPVVSSKVKSNSLTSSTSSSFGESFEFKPSSLFTNKVNPTRSSTFSSFGSFGGSFDIEPTSLFTNEAPVFPAPTLFAGLAQHAKFNQIGQNQPSITTTILEKKNIQPERSSETPSLLKPASFSFNDKNKSSAFRPVKTIAEVVQPLDDEEVGLNTEVEVNTKIGQQYGIKHVPRCDNGAFNVVAKLLTSGDQHVRILLLWINSIFS